MAQADTTTTVAMSDYINIVEVLPCIVVTPHPKCTQSLGRPQTNSKGIQG